MTVRSAQAIGSGIAAADDDDVLTCSHNLIEDVVPGNAFILLRQEFHGIVNALQIPSWDV